MMVSEKIFIEFIRWAVVPILLLAFGLSSYNVWKDMKYIQNRTNWCWVAACKVVGEQYKKNFTEFAFTLESPETEVAVSNLDGLRTDIVKRRNGKSCSRT